MTEQSITPVETSSNAPLTNDEREELNRLRRLENKKQWFSKHNKITGMLILCLVMIICAVGSGHPEMVWEVVALHGTAVAAIIFVG